MRLDSTSRFGCTLLLALVLAPGSAAAADPFLSPPGVAERGLAGAAAAGPGSLASAWHNPATLVDARTRVTGEWQAAPDRARDGNLEASGNAWLVGASYVNRNKWYGTAAIGFASYTPHTKKLWVERSGEADSAFGRSNLTTQVIGVPYAVELEDSGLALGVVGEIVAVDPSGSELRVEDASGSLTEATVPSDRQVGYSGAFGARYRLHDEATTRVDIGGVVRLRATSGASVEVEPAEAALLMPDKPGGLDLGVRWRRELNDDRELAAHVQYGSTDWGSAGDMRRDALAVSFRSPFDAWGAFEAGERVLRLGYGRFRPKPAESWIDWPEGYVLAGGASFFFHTGTRVDLVLERRREERDRFDDQTSWFGGLAVGLAY